MITDFGVTPWGELPEENNNRPWFLESGITYTLTVSDITRTKEDIIQDINKLLDELKQV